MAEPKAADTERWRAKYYESLEELETKEKEWQQIEELLRSGLGRLAQSIPSLDPLVDRRLGELRAALRRGSKSAALSKLLEELDRELSRVESAGASAPSGIEPARALLAEVAQRALAGRAPQEGKLVQAALASASSVEDLRRAVDRIVSTLEVSQPTAQELPLHVALLRFLEHLSVPAELNDRLDALKARLTTELPPEQTDEILRAIADLVADMRFRILRDKRELEDFLKQLTENLKELDHNVHTTVVSQLESFTESRKLGLTVNAQMKDLEESAQAASELDALKSAIQQRVKTIRDHMDAFRQAEDSRAARAEKDVATLTSRLTELETETRGLRERIRRERSQALIDPLTGIFNRLAYEERIEQEYQRWKRYRSPLVLSVWDVDRFKRINDTFGHQAGDKVLRVVATLLKSQVRATDFVCRYGGEEFIILLPETDLEHAKVAIEKLRAGVEAAEFHYRNEKVKITVSCGMAEFRGEDTADEVFARADKALYVAKDAGRNCCRVGEES